MITMVEFERGPIQHYEITWMSGHVETVLAHQVSYPHAGFSFAGSVLGVKTDAGPPRIQMHAEIDGMWVLTLSAREEDIRTIRNVTHAERMPS